MSAHSVPARWRFRWWSVWERVLLGRTAKLNPAEITAERERLAGNSALNECIRSLPILRQLVFLRRYYYLETADEIALHCGIPADFALFLLWENRLALNRWVAGSGE